MNMKYIVKLFVITYLIFGTTNSFAESKIVYIDLNLIMNNSIAGKSITSQLEKNHKKNIVDFEKIEEELGGETIGYILDIRSNPGGLLKQAVKVSDEILSGFSIYPDSG